jgi:hypothetical protein
MTISITPTQDEIARTTEVAPFSHREVLLISAALPSSLPVSLHSCEYSLSYGAFNAILHLF